jgi:hypothetical protein
MLRSLQVVSSSQDVCISTPPPIWATYPTHLSLVINAPNCVILMFYYFLSGVRPSPLGTAATTGLSYQPQMIDDGDYGEIRGMKIGRENRSTRRKPASAPLCRPQIPHDQTWARTRVSAVEACD